MRLPILSAFAALCLALPTTAQKLQVFGGNVERASSWQLLFGENLAAGISVTYGQGVWKDTYDAMLEKLKGRLNRLGKDWWTTFTTSVDIELGGVKVAAGSYVLGLDCDKDGKFSLAFLDAGKAMKQGALPFSMNEEGTMNWKPDFLTPLELHKDSAKEVVEKMTMTLKANKDDLSKGSFTLAWGKHTLTANLAVVQAKTEPAKK